MKFLDRQEPIPGVNVRFGDFWQWAYSDISRTGTVLFLRNTSWVLHWASSTSRGSNGIRQTFEYRGFKIEVQSSAYLQSWAQGGPSRIIFSIRKARFWNPETGKFEGQPTRCACLYVFCHYSELDKTKANVLCVPAWDFYVISTDELNRTFTRSHFHWPQ